MFLVDHMGKLKNGNKYTQYVQIIKLKNGNKYTQYVQIIMYIIDQFILGQEL